MFLFFFLGKRQDMVSRFWRFGRNFGKFKVFVEIERFWIFRSGVRGYGKVCLWTEIRTGIYRGCAPPGGASGQPTKESTWGPS